MTDPTRLVSDSASSESSVIVVTVNFRLNIFAFGDGQGELNLALKDQRLAIEWVVRNISAFGGDPVSLIDSYPEVKITD